MDENNKYENELETNPQEVSEQIDDSDIEETLDEDVESLENLEELEDDSLDTQNQRSPRFGEKEYNAAKNEQGVYDKNYYANRKKELDNSVAHAQNEKNNSKKEVLKKNEQGEKVPVQKNKNVLDKAKDNVNLMRAKNERFQNKLNNAKAKMYNVMHPGEALKDRAKSAVKNTAKNVGKKAGKAIGKAGKAAAKAAGKAIATGAKALVKLIVSNPYVAIALIVIIFVLFLIIFLFGGSNSSGNNNVGLYGYQYVENQSGCTQITVSGDYAGVYNLEKYIAGVVEAEVGGFLVETRREAAKAGAVAARSYLLTHVDSNCTIENSTRFQTYKTPSDAALAVAEETKGLVLVNSSGNVASTQYDAFCTASPQDDSDNYIVCQQSQKIPRDWVDNQGGQIKDSWKDGTKTEAHGNGMSQWGAAYLAEEKGYDFKEILAYYYTDLELMSIYRSFGGGNYPIEPDNEKYQNLAFLKDQSFMNFIESKGITMTAFNENLYNEIEKAGIGTRDGVVTAAVSLIGSLADMGVKLNYQWGGKYYNLGANPFWGANATSSWNCDNYASVGYDKSHCEKNYQWISFDCSGFVNWALRNGMQDTSIAIQETSTSGGTTLSANKAVCEPGGTLVSEGHIVLVVGIDEENSRYIIAESTGSDVSKGTGGVKLSYYSFNKKGYVCKNLNDIYGD